MLPFYWVLSLLRDRPRAGLFCASSKSILLLFPVGAVVVGGYGEQSHVGAIAHGGGSACLCDAQRVDRVNASWRGLAHSTPSFSRLIKSSVLLSLGGLAAAHVRAERRSAAA